MAVSRSLLATTVLCAGGIATAATALQGLSVTAPDDEEAVLFSADSIRRDNETSPILAEGNVRAFFGAQSLVADEVTYNPETDIVTANGNVIIYDETGQTFFADSVELTGDLKDGVASNFGALLERQNRLVGSTIIRRSSGTNTIENGAFTACEVCREDGSVMTPTWQVKAVRVTQDENTKTIRFNHATIEAFGVPILYTPYFQFPDPSVKRKSGLLAPSIGNSSRAGFEIEVPYYWAISDHQDATFSPRYMSELGTLWKGEYRVKSHDAGFIIQAGAIDPEGVIRNRTGDGGTDGRIDLRSELDDDELAAILAAGEADVGPRWHVFAAGEKRLANNWVGRADIDLVSDKRYLRTYDISPQDELQEAIDILQPDRLENELSLTRQTRDNFTDISMLMFQSLRLSEDNDFTANALPRIRHKRRYDAPVIGGDISLSGDILVLHRQEGLDTMRAISQAAWNQVHTTSSGHRLRAHAELRGDFYRYTDANRGVQACRNDQPVDGTDFILTADYEACREFLPRAGLEEEFTTARFLPTAGVEWSYPLAKFTSNASFIIEPRLQAVVSPDEDFSDDVFNEDSAFFEFDTVTLFDWTKSTGYDQWEDGQRFNVGIRATANYNNGLNLSGAIGQQYRVSESLNYDEDTGLGDTTSDIVGELNAGFRNNLRMSNRFRIDEADGTLRRLESNLSGRAGPASAGIKYVRTETQELSIDGDRDEYLTASAYYDFTDRITAGGIWREDLDAGETTTQQFVVQYSDSCTVFSLAYRYDNRTADGLEDNRSLTFNVDLIGF